MRGGGRRVKRRPAAPLEFADHIGMPMREGLLFVHNALVGAGLRERIRGTQSLAAERVWNVLTPMAWTSSCRCSEAWAR